LAGVPLDPHFLLGAHGGFHKPLGPVLVGVAFGHVPADKPLVLG
jgi:hypothetical protein